MDFVAIDLETANADLSSICQANPDRCLAPIRVTVKSIAFRTKTNTFELS